MPALRERCKTNLRVSTTNALNKKPTKPAPQKHKRTQHITRISQIVPSAYTYDPHLYPIHTPSFDDVRHLHRIVPELYVGFYRGAHPGIIPSSLVTDDGALFTHIVRILPADNGNHGRRDVTFQRDPVRGVLYLSLCVRKATAGSRRLGLTRRQLSYARDFLGLALPYYHMAHRRNGAQKNVYSVPADSVRVLVIAPYDDGVFGSEVDVMAIVVCYLVYASGEPAEQILGYIGAEEEVPDVWRGAIGVGVVAGEVARVIDEGAVLDL